MTNNYLVTLDDERDKSFKLFSRIWACKFRSLRDTSRERMQHLFNGKIKEILGTNFNKTGEDWYFQYVAENGEKKVACMGDLIQLDPDYLSWYGNYNDYIKDYQDWSWAVGWNRCKLTEFSEVEKSTYSYFENGDDFLDPMDFFWAMDNLKSKFNHKTVDALLLWQKERGVEQLDINLVIKLAVKSIQDLDSKGNDIYVQMVHDIKSMNHPVSVQCREAFLRHEFILSGENLEVDNDLMEEVFNYKNRSPKRLKMIYLSMFVDIQV